MSDRVALISSQMKRGISYDVALRNVAVGDAVHDRAEALREALNMAREFLCLSLDGPPIEEWARDPAFKDAVPKMEAAWRDFREAVQEAQGIVGRAG